MSESINPSHKTNIPTKKNIKIREALKKYNMRQWELAQLLDMGETTLARTLRAELPEDVQKKVIELIEHSRNK